MQVEERARVHRALGDTVRLAIVDDLVVSDLSPMEIAERHGLATNLLTHHLDVLESAGLVERRRSSGDARRKYVHLVRRRLGSVGFTATAPTGSVLFVCTHNSARSQLAAAAWSAVSGSAAFSAGTHPADQVHPGAVSAASRAGLDLSGASPNHISDVDIEPVLVVTVCDQAHEELSPRSHWWHWSIPDPVASASPEAFDWTLTELRNRIDAVTKGTP